MARAMPRAQVITGQRSDRNRVRDPFRHISLSKEHAMRFSVLLAALCSPVAASAGDLTVTVDHVRSDRGAILAALYDSEASFMKQPLARATFKVKAAAGEVSYVFHDLPAGKYALAVFHDENENGQLDKNFVGIPREGYGFS